jgi:hypothetical protein
LHELLGLPRPEPKTSSFTISIDAPEAMVHLGGLAEWLDLDACALITNDSFEGMTFDDGAIVSVTDRPGMGVIQKVL